MLLRPRSFDVAQSHYRKTREQTTIHPESAAATHLFLKIKPP
jgi:hypothetical protein